MPSKSKIKGSGFEREVAKFLTETYKSSFQRNISGSGAFVGGKNNIRKSTLSESQLRNSKGDIVPPDDWVNFNAEAKFYGDLAYHQLFTSCSQLDEWIKQVNTVSDTNDINIIFFKINRKGKYVVVESKYDWILSDINHLVYKNWIVIDFDMFFKYNTDILQKYCKGF